jgi:hypothetical protein
MEILVFRLNNLDADQKIYLFLLYLTSARIPDWGELHCCVLGNQALLGQPYFPITILKLLSKYYNWLSQADGEAPTVAKIN